MTSRKLPRKRGDEPEVHIRNFQRTFPVDSTGARSLAARTLAELKASCSSVSIVFVGPKKIRDLNRTYRGRDEVTDVLSFPQEEGPGGVGEEGELGDVVVCPFRADSQAREAGKPFEEELRLLVVHGLLHLCGVHHDSERERRRMERLQRRILGDTS